MHGGRGADDALRRISRLDLRPEREHFFLEALALKIASYGMENVVKLERLGDVAVSAKGGCLNRDIGRAIRSHKDDGHFALLVAELFQYLDACHAGEAHIEEHQVVTAGSKAL